MTNEDIFDLIRQCQIPEGRELIPGKAYHFDRKFDVKVSYSGGYRIEKIQSELIVLVEDGVKVGAIYRMGDVDIHIVIDKKYQGRHIMSDFLRTGIINQLWPKIRSVKLCGVYTRRDYEKKKHLVQLCHLTIRNAEEIEKHLQWIDKCKKRNSVDKRRKGNKHAESYGKQYP